MTERGTHLGTTDDKGQFYIVNAQKFNAYLKRFPRSRFVITIEKLEPEPGPVLRSYFYSYMLPIFQKRFHEFIGERLTKKETEEKLARMSPVTISETVDPENGVEFDRIREVHELNKGELLEFVEHMHEIGAKHFGITFERFTR